MNIYMYTQIYRFRLSQALAQYRTSVLTMLNHVFLLFKLVKRKHLTKNWFLLTLLAYVAYILTFSVIPVVLMLSLKLKQDGPNKMEVY
jgi:hypothetical protein